MSSTKDPKSVRTAACGWATRASRDLETLVSNPSVDLDQLNDAISQFDKRLESLDNAQEVYELTLDEDDMETDIELAADFRSKVRAPRVLAVQLVKKLSCSGLATDKGDNGSNTSSTIEAKLPNLQLPCFSGKITERMPF